MKIVELDGYMFTDIVRTHVYLQKRLELPDYYGRNLDALWDCLTSWIVLPVLIVWKHYDKSYDYLGKYAEDLKNVFMDAEREIEGLKIEIYSE